MEELTLLHTKLDKLLKKHAAMKAEKEGLEEELRKQKTELEKLNKKVTNLEGQLATAKTAEALTGKEDKTAVRKELDVLIGDIDKLLASLDD
ncbi:MAG: hypothetical protein H6551_03865 [Chitinophagales bacterium]|nr:hypothetical protein [Chitinophagaceae bacterium]MCB9064260.1 hypothetical protein [Chitinophagales bacterium]